MYVSWLLLCIIVFFFVTFRLEMLQQIANRVQRDCVAGEDKLALAHTALQSVSNTQLHALIFSEVEVLDLCSFTLGKES